MSTIESTIAPAGTWTLDPVHSTIGFEVGYLVGTFKGQFRDVAAQLDVGETGARLAGRASVASVDVKDENLAAHLQSPDFFDAETHPELRFLADDFAIDGGTVTVDGEITIKGVTKPVEISGTITAPSPDYSGNPRIGAVLSATVDRTDFGVNWNAPLPGGDEALGNEVTINAELYFTKSD
jgi:polyisoprenoid-binding protein YceI